SLLDVRSAALYRVDPASGDLVQPRVFGEGAQRANLLAAGIPAGTGAVGLAIRDRAPVLTRDIASDRRLVFPDAYRPLMREMPNRAALAVPLVANGHVPGGLVLYAPTGRRFTPAEARLAQTFADHAAVAFDKARLFAELEGLY